MARTRSPAAVAYCTARWPSPPPAPGRTIQSPSFAPEYLIARYTVRPCAIHLHQYHRKEVCGKRGRTAQRMDAASALARPAGMGVTCRTKERTYSEKVPSTVKPLYLPFRQPASAKTRRWKV